MAGDGMAMFNCQRVTAATAGESSNDGWEAATAVRAATPGEKQQCDPPACLHPCPELYVTGILSQRPGMLRRCPLHLSVQCKFDADSGEGFEFRCGVANGQAGFWAQAASTDVQTFA